MKIDVGPLDRFLLLEIILGAEKRVWMQKEIDAAAESWGNYRSYQPLWKQEKMERRAQVEEKASSWLAWNLPALGLEGLAPEKPLKST